MAATAFSRKRALSVTATCPPPGKRSRPTPDVPRESRSDGSRPARRKKIRYLRATESLIPQFPLAIQQAAVFFRTRSPYWAVSELSDAMLRDNFLRWLFAVGEKDDKYVDLIVLEMLERMAKQDVLKLPTGVLNTTVKREDGQAKNALWVMMFGTVACAGDHCDKMLIIVHMYNKRMSTVEWYAPSCGHDLRFCTACSAARWCWMCDDERDMTHRFVQQSILDKPSDHPACLASPCASCAFFVAP